MLQAMGTGVEGSMTTVHANTPADAFSRLETMVMMAKLDLPSKFVRQQMASVVHMLVQTARLSDGSRKVTAIAEVDGIENNEFLVNTVFEFHRTGVRSDGHVEGVFRCHGASAKFLERLRLAGQVLPNELLTPRDELVV